LGEFGIPGFNDTELKPGAQEILTIAGRPLLVAGRYGQVRTVAFTGFTPAFSERHSEWDAKVVFPYLVDQELYQDPVTKAYFHMFMQLLSAATGEKPQTSYEAILAAREEPLFEVLKDLPPAELKTPEAVPSEKVGNKACFSLRLTNGDRYARLVRVRTRWRGESSQAPILSYIATIISTSFPEKVRRFRLRFFSPKGSADPSREHRLLRVPMFQLRRSRSTSMQERPLSLSRHGERG
jgi:hypothetical protein